MTGVFDQLKGKIVVSCQAYVGDPLDDVEALQRIALAVVKGGAAGLRLNSAAQIAAARRDTDLPIIGIEKKYGPMGLRITPDFASAEALARAGASIIALECTDREWKGAEPWRELIARIHRELRLPVMADVATLDEALAAADAGADCVGTTLYGYTKQTSNGDMFSWSLLADLRRQLDVPIMAEGHISTPEEARRAIDEGAWCAIVGSAITRPGDITSRFARAVEVPKSQLAVGIDIGGTAIKAGLVRPGGEVCFASNTPTEAARGRDAIASGLVLAIEQTLSSARARQFEPASIGIATAGVVDHRDGSIFAATDNLPGWAGFPLRTFAEERFHLPVAVVNDAQAAVLSELYFGEGRGLSDFVVITLGTGVGGGIVSAGKLLRGRHGFGGSIGHAVIHAGGRPCNCGRLGCLEAYVSTTALVREYLAQNGGAMPVEAVDEAALALEINRLARSGDSMARNAYGVLAGHLAEGIANTYNLLDPQAVILSGGLIEGYESFVTDLQERVSRLLHFGAKRDVQLRAATSGRFAGVQGAAALAFASA